MGGWVYVGATCMNGKFKDFQIIIKVIVKSAIYVHCSNHCLNLALSTGSDLASIKKYRISS